MQVFLTPPLPGGLAQADMAPDYRRADIEAGHCPKTAQDAAVLVMLSPPVAGDSLDLLEWKVLLILRTSDQGPHSGQMAFPGGKSEPEDQGLWDTACREAFEEVGVLSDMLSKVASLTPLYVPPSNFLIHPFVGVCLQKITLQLSPKEVVKAIYVPLHKLDPAKAVQVNFNYGKDAIRSAPAWNYEGHIIWGATAMILAELHRVIATGSLTVLE